MTLLAPKWTSEQFNEARLQAIELFRQQRMQEPLEDYLSHFSEARASMENLLELTVDFKELNERAGEALSTHLQAVRYLAGPPISNDDLKVVAGDADGDVSLAPSRLTTDAVLASRIVQTVLLGLDRERFPWVSEDREPTEAERASAITATSALIAARKVLTARANESKEAQEQLVKDALSAAGFNEVPTRDISTLAHAPKLGEFCGESNFGTRKADIVIRLWDQRVMALECKVSNSSTNSVKRLNNDAAVKAKTWLEQFGTAQMVPAAMLAGVFKLHNLESAQQAGLTIWWSQDNDTMLNWIERTRP
jgi:hypothetical protein